MVIKNFQELLERQNKQVTKQKIAVVAAADEHSLSAVFDPAIKETISPVLIGDTQKINSLLSKKQIVLDSSQIIQADTDSEAAQIAVDLASKGEVDGLMKGHIQTRDFLKPVVAKETGIVADSLLSHIVINEIPAYPKLLVTTDGGMVTEPTYEQKIVITEHGLAVLKKLGYKQPKVAILAAAETVNPRIASSVEAEKLQEYFMEKYPEACQIDGPLSFDLAVSPEIAKLKGYQSPVAGQADMLVGPDMTATNILGKSLMVMGGGKMAGIIYGAKVPIVMTSRGSSSEEKYLSLLLASILGQKEGDK